MKYRSRFFEDLLVGVASGLAAHCGTGFAGIDAVSVVNHASDLYDELERRKAAELKDQQERYAAERLADAEAARKADEEDRARWAAEGNDPAKYDEERSLPF